MEDRKEAIRKEADRLLPEQMYFCRGSLEDLEEINEIEHICFPENEACSREHFVKRLTVAPEHFLLSLGYSGWSEGQLEAELSVSGWLVAPADESIIFDTPVEERYEKALSLLGIDSVTLEAWGEDAGHA